MHKQLLYEIKYENYNFESETLKKKVYVMHVWAVASTRKGS